MKKLNLLSLLFISISTFAQLNYDKWETVELTDEFGDKTGETITRIFGKGTFDNSATTNAKLIVKIADYGDSGIYMDLYEYGTPPSASLTYESQYGTFSVKRENGDIETYRGLASKKGGLLFSKNNEFSNLLRNGLGETLKIVIKESRFSKYGRSVYSFGLITKGKKENKNELELDSGEKLTELFSDRVTNVLEKGANKKYEDLKVNSKWGLFENQLVYEMLLDGKVAFKDIFRLDSKKSMNKNGFLIVYEGEGKKKENMLTFTINFTLPPSKSTVKKVVKNKVSGKIVLEEIYFMSIKQ